MSDQDRVKTEPIRMREKCYSMLAIMAALEYVCTLNEHELSTFLRQLRKAQKTADSAEQKD